MELLSPTNDFVFKKLFSENKGILQNFLTAVLDLPPEEYKELQIVDPALEQRFQSDKLGVLDVKILLKSGKVIDVEMQVQSQIAIWKRMNFYTSKLVVEQLKSGFGFNEINQAISILIADFIMIRESAAYHHCFRWYDEKNKVRYRDSTEIDILELPKLKGYDGTPLGDWLNFFKARTEEDFMKAAEKNPAIDKAKDFIIYLSGDERERAIADSREKYRMDKYEWEADARQEGRQEGLNEGLHKGRQESILDVARTALAENVPHGLIAKLTGLSADEIERLAAELKH